MAWGLWNKIKQGVRKAGKWIKNAAQTVTQKVIKPFKPVISTIAGAINPTIGAAVTAGMNAFEKWSDDGARATDVPSALKWGQEAFKRQVG